MDINFYLWWREPIKREDEERDDGDGYYDIGGYRKQLAVIREMIK